jgi:hypothetical protein
MQPNLFEISFTIPQGIPEILEYSRGQRFFEADAAAAVFSPRTIAIILEKSEMTFDFFSPLFFSTETKPEGIIILDGNFAVAGIGLYPRRFAVSVSSSRVGSFTDLFSGVRLPCSRV